MEITIQILHIPYAFLYGYVGNIFSSVKADNLATKTVTVFVRCLAHVINCKNITARNNIFTKSTRIFLAKNLNKIQHRVFNACYWI